MGMQTVASLISRVSITLVPLSLLPMAFTTSVPQPSHEELLAQYAVAVEALVAAGIPVPAIPAGASM